MKTAGSLFGLCGAIVFLTSNCVPLVCTQKVHNDIIKVEINPDKTNNITTYKKMVIFSENEDEFLMTIGSDVTFFVIQVHTFMKDVFLSDSDQFDNHTFVTGSNVGLVQKVDGDVNSFNFFLRNTLDNGTVLIVVNTYGNKDPIPGGCNLTYDVENAPYQLVSYNDDLIQIDVQPAAVGFHMCEEKLVKIEMYRLYLDAYDHSEITYFSGLMRMLTVKDILRHGTKVNEPIYPSLRRYYASYKGIGSVYAAVATYKNGVSMYVPTVSYGCNIHLEDGNCKVPYIWYVLLPYSLTAGVCLLIVRGEMLTTYASLVFMASLVTFYILSSFYIVFLLAYIPLGLLMGIIISSLVHRFKVSHFAKSLILAYFLATFFLFMPYISNFSFLQHRACYWAIFSIVIVLTSILTNTYPEGRPMTDRLTAVILLIFGLSYCLGGIQFYCIINNIRQITTGNFNLAFIDPPFQFGDVVALTCVVLVMICKDFCRRRSIFSRNPEMSPLLG